MPEATTRLAALRSGQVDWIEVPPPDAIPSLKQAGFDISLWPYPHTYPYLLRATPGGPFADRRVRQAMNYAIDRDSVCKLINDTGKPAVGLYHLHGLKPAVAHASPPHPINHFYSSVPATRVHPPGRPSPPGAGGCGWAGPGEAWA